jgi:hypothetical protein
MSAFATLASAAAALGIVAIGDGVDHLFLNADNYVALSRHLRQRAIDVAAVRSGHTHRGRRSVRDPVHAFFGPVHAALRAGDVADRSAAFWWRSYSTIDPATATLSDDSPGN